MKLLNCHIENFGKLHDFDYNFKDKLNIIKEDNGFGKTTFAAFIKSMFYGLEGDNKRGISSERKKYMPWQGGKFGGNIEFDVNGKKYRIQRFFGSKKSEDTFILYDLITNLESNDYSENIGEELFKINSEGYERSTYIPQGKIPIEINDSLSAKLMNVMENDNDINASDIALNSINNAKRILKKERGKGGLIDETDDKIKNLNLILEENKYDVIELANKKESYDNLVKSLKSFELQKENLAKDIEKAQENEKINAIRQSYDQLNSDFLILKNENEKFSSFFKNGIPNDDELEKLSQDNEKLNEFKIKSDSLELSNSEKNELTESIEKYKNIDEKIIDDCLKNVSIIQENKTKISQNNVEISIKNSEISRNDNEISSNQLEKEKLKNEIKDLQNKLQKNELERLNIRKNSKNEFNKKTKKLLIIGIVFICLGLVLVLDSVGLGIFTLIVGAILIIISKNKKKKLSQFEERYQEDKKNDAGINEQIDNLEQKINSNDNEKKIDEENKKINEEICKLKDSNNDLERQNEKLNEDVLKLAKSFDLNEYRINTELNDLRLKYNRFRDLKSKNEKISEEKSLYKNKIENLQMKISDELSKYYNLDDSTSDVSYNNLIQDLILKSEKYVNNQHQFELKKQAIDEFKNANFRYLQFINHDEKEKFSDKVFNEVGEITSNEGLGENNKKISNENENINENIEISDNIFDGSEEATNIEELREKAKTIDEKIKNSTEEKAKINTEIEALQSKIDENEYLPDEIENLKEKKAEYQKRFDILSKTEKLLKIAKNNFSSTYSSKMEKGFKEYFDYINDKEIKSNIDIKLNVNFDIDGEKRNTNKLSLGYQDLVYICVRFSLVKAMFKDEKPFVVLDDPFVNLDEEKTKKAIDVLNKFANEYQVIYFVCNKSRI